MNAWTVVLGQICRMFNQGQIPWALFGGAAVSAYDPNRKIQDIDILTVDSGLRYLADSLNIAIQIYLHDQQYVQIAEIQVYGTLRIRTNAGTHPFMLDTEMTSRREHIKLASLELPILSREDHIVLKAILQRGHESGKCDLEDIHIMSRAGPLDIQYIQHRIELCAAQGRADKLLRTLGVLA
jgi:predicted nucleotidyltransferase